MSQQLPKAIQAWTDALGPPAVASDAEALARYGRTTQDSAPQPSCVLYPESLEAVQSAVRIAAQFGIVVYPISCGKNWGYGDACAPVEGAAIMDLGRMNRIVEVNTELAYAVIEPGVTQQQLYAYLNENKTNLWLDCAAAGLDASLVGNTLDRGFGHTRYGDHYLTCCGMEVVLADGRILKTGFSHYENGKAARVYRYGVGPALDGLFCQSNFGIVTKIGLWLMPKPEVFEAFFIRVDRHDDLAALVNALRPLRMAGVLTSAIHIGNDLRVLSGSGRYPWVRTGGATPLPDDIRAQLSAESGLGAWMACGALTGSRGHVRASRKALRRAVGSLGRLVFVNDTKLAMGAIAGHALRLVGLGAKLRAQLDAIRPNYGLLKGIPTDAPLLGTQWRLRHPPDTPDGNPLEHGCGLMWVSPVLPATGANALTVMTLTEPIFKRFGFDPLATFTLISDRAIIAILNVVFDKSDAGETQRAADCYDALMKVLMSEGYIPYRLALRGMSRLRSNASVYWDVTRQLKHALDPNDIIARGRYIAPLDTQS